MESLLGGFQLPFQRRLTKMYTDTKSSYDFVKEPIAPAEDPTLTSLHRKLRIQKDRLVSWGLAWSDSSQSPDIDESLSQAGLGDVVGSVMATIKDILAEAEPLWQSSRRQLRFGSDGASDRSTEKRPSLAWDRSRFEDLVNDLTISIDTLYDLSRSRQNMARMPMTKNLNTSVVSLEKEGVEEQKLFESTRMQTPQQIDPEVLIDPRSLHQASDQRPLVFSNPAIHEFESRKIMYMRRQISSTNPWKLGGPPPLVPILLEYASFDPIYANTGISPSMARFEKLFSGLQTFQGADRPDFGSLNLIGYFEDADNARFGLLYEMPKRFGPLEIDVLEKYGIPYIVSLSDLLVKQLEPPLEAKYRLAYNLATSVFELHSKGVVHGNVGARNVAFFEKHFAGSRESTTLSKVNVGRPFLTSFDLFPDSAAQYLDDNENKWYRHALDPRMTPDTIFTSESRSLELYTLAQLLVEIALWTPSNDILSEQSDGFVDPVGLSRQIAIRCGSSYLKAIQACWKAIDDDLTNHARPDVALQQVYGKVLNLLERCCGIDDGMAEDATFEVRDDPYKKTPESLAPVRTDNLVDNASSIDKMAVEKTHVPENFPSTMTVRELDPIVKPKPKLRRFPLNKLGQEHLDEWHKVLMPSINQALRGFYRKYPESVEISLESVGETAQNTKPTIVVICTSVGKVRSILKRNFIYDSSTYGLLVCRGMVLRSRKNKPVRSMAGEGDDVVNPMNSQYQERPTNGASIGAYVGGQHLMPVSFGGLIEVDNKTYGLTVHHMLDDPSDEGPIDDVRNPALRSSDQQKMLEGAFKLSPDQMIEDEEFGYELSETGSDTSSVASSFEFADEEEDIRLSEPGDLEGIPKDCGDGYVVTQPAYDDVDESFLASDEGREDDHLDTFALGEIYASSGIRRRYEDGLTHEIDWALFEFNHERQPVRNFISGGEKHCHMKGYPADYMPSSKLHDLEVHGVGRTSGLQTGRISPGMVVLKIFGRQTPSDSYQVHGGLGIPGDSGAWVIDNEQGRACGHVLAWSSRKRVAYICPMEIILKDIAEELGAKSVTFPSSQVLPVEGNLDASSQKDTTSVELKSFVDGNLQAPVLNETLGIAKMKAERAVKYSMSEPEDDDIVATMSTMHLNSNVAITARDGV